jgi:O-antigen/teichoic acid export membrane protein
MSGASETGMYAAGYDLAFQPISVILFIINLTALPLAIRALESEGVESATSQLQKNGRLFFAVALAAAASTCVLAPNIGQTIVGAEYRESAIALLPWVACAACFAGLKSYYFDTAFHLSRQTVVLVWISIVVAMVNVIGNITLIPRFGILGAAIATLLAYCAGCILSALVGRRLFPMPKILPMIPAAVGIAILACIPAWFGTLWSGWIGLVIGGLGSVVLAFVGALAFGVFERSEIQWIANRGEKQ